MSVSRTGYNWCKPCILSISEEFSSSCALKILHVQYILIFSNPMSSRLFPIFLHIQVYNLSLVNLYPNWKYKLITNRQKCYNKKRQPPMIPQSQNPTVFALYWSTTAGHSVCSWVSLTYSVVTGGCSCIFWPPRPKIITQNL